MPAAYMAEVHAGRVRRVAIEDQEVIIGVSTTFGRFRSPYRESDDAGLPNQLRALGVEVVFKKSPLGLI